MDDGEDYDFMTTSGVDEIGESILTLIQRATKRDQVQVLRATAVQGQP